MLANKKIILADIETSRFQRKAGIPHYSKENFQNFLSLTRDREAFLKSPYGIAHSGGQLYQVYAQMPMFRDPEKTFIAPVDWHEQWHGMRITGGKEDYSKQTKLWDAVQQHGFRKNPDGTFAFGRNEAINSVTLESKKVLNLGQFETAEAARMAEFMENLIHEANQGGGVALGAHNALFDISGLQHALFKYPSLEKYWGTFSQLAAAGKFGVVPTESPYLKLLWNYGQHNQKWANTYLRDLSTSTRIRNAEELRNVPGWAAQKLVKQFGLTEEPKYQEAHRALLKDLEVNLGAHEAIHDTELFTRPLFERMVRANRTIQRYTDAGKTPPFTRILKRYFPKMEGNAESAFTALAGSHNKVEEFQALARASRRDTATVKEFSFLKETVGEVPKGLKNSQHLIYGALTAVLIDKLVREDSRSRKTQLSGLRDEGVAQYLRHEKTDFGSGYRADEDRPTLKWAGILTAIAGGVALHKYKLASSPGYAEKFYQVVKAVETASPAHILSTFRAGEMASSYLPKTLEFERWSVVERIPGKKPALTLLGEQFQKLLGKDTDLLKLEGKLAFERQHAADPYLKLVRANRKEGDQLISMVRDQSVRFMERGKIAGSSFRHELPISRGELWQPTIGRPPVQRFFGMRVPGFGKPYVERFVGFKKSQYAIMPPVARGLGAGLDKATNLQFLPVLGRKTTEPFFKQVYERAKFTNFFLAERGHELLSHTLGMGLKRGTYNSTTSMLGGLLLKRALPAYAAWTGARYLDYKTGHHGRDFAADLGARVHLGYAAFTDTVPGWRSATDYNRDHIPGPKFAPFAAVATGAFIGGALHYGKFLQSFVNSSRFVSKAERLNQFRKFTATGALIGGIAAAPFLAGAVGSRKSMDQLQREYAGIDMVPVRAGRWWDLGNESLQGGKISFFMPNWYQRLKSGAFVKGNFKSEKFYWSHHPLLHPLKYLQDPYAMERAQYYDRPFPITSPAFTNVPLIGDVLAATIGKLVKPPKLMHKGEWSDEDYSVGGPKLQPKGREALAARKLEQEYNLKHVFRRQAERFFDWSGLPGYMMKQGFQSVFGSEDMTPYMQGSRQMTDISRMYYERQYGAMVFLGMDDMKQIGYSEPIRRFLVNQPKGIQVNEIPNQMPSWLPGEGEYAFNFRAGDPYSRIPFGYLRLPGPGFESLHPELKGTDPEKYPAITKLQVLADVAPTSTKFFYYKSIVERQAETDMGMRIELDRIMQRVDEQKRSAIHAYKPKFLGESETIHGTVEEATTEGVRLAEYPGRTFRFSGVGLSAVDMSAAALGEQNRHTRNQVIRDTENKLQAANAYLSKRMAPGTHVSVTLPLGAAEHAQTAPAVFRTGGETINRELLDAGFGTDRLRDAGPEAAGMSGTAGRVLGTYAEGLGRALSPSPYFTKLWNARPPMEEYLKNEYYGSRGRGWDSPIQDFLGPYARGAVYHLTGVPIISEQNANRRDLDTMRDQMQYLRALDLAAQDPDNRGTYMAQAARTNIGANLFSSPDRLELTLPRRDRPYFSWMAEETNPKERSRMLQYASPELARTLSGQWLKQDIEIARAEGRTDIPITPYRGRPVGTELIRQKADYQGRVVDVIDGDSLMIQTAGGKKEVRLADVNAPEMPTYAGALAKQRTRDMVLGRNVWVNVTQQSDHYGRQVGEVFTDNSRFLNDDLMKQGKAGEMQFSAGEHMAQAPSEYQRSREIAEFFARKRMHLPEGGSEAYAPELDYEDVKLKILNEEGYNYHDFGIFQDRAAVLYRKPYVNGAVRELSMPSGRSSESLRMTVEQMITNAYDKNPKVRTVETQGFGGISNLTVTTRYNPEDDIRRDIRRNRDKWN